MQLREFAEDIWTADGPPIPAFGFSFPSRMIVVKLSDGSVWINSPIETDAEQMQAVAQIGPVKYLVSPTPLHNWRLEAWAKAFPQAQRWSIGSGAQHKLTGEVPTAWAADLEQLVFTGSRVLDEVEFLHKPSRTLIFADFIQQYAARPGKALFNALTKLAGLRDGCVPPDIRLSFAGNKAKGRKSLEMLLSWDFERFIPAHGDCLERGAKPFVRSAFDWLGLPS
jgi:uncharacterized protein DUF4336